jgi:uncharacterized protein with von Willebrand factor type A (vWA) domain
MKQSWRYLRRSSREGPKTELDLAATLRQVGQAGILLEPVLRPRRQNHVELLLLIDQGGSMVPFHRLSRQLIHTATRSARFRQTNPYYFHNCPHTHVYSDPHHQEGITLSQLPLTPRWTVVMIFSDAGALRGGHNPQRVTLTAQFLAQLQPLVNQITWLNPVPRQRWLGTAAKIATLVPMFELDRSGFQGAIDVLRGYRS